MGIRLLALERDNPEAWALLPAALERVTSFAKRYQLDTTPEALSQGVMANFIAPQPSVRLCAALRGEALVGHLLVSLEDWSGRRYGWIVQYEMDDAFPRAMLQAFFDEQAAWCRARGATALRIQATLADELGLARVRLFRALWGFRPVRVVMEREIGVEAGGGD
jgi:hypothetical protein